MEPKSRRRVHGADFKAQVLAECRQPGASVAAVALAHGLNVNLVRKWLVGCGLKRAGVMPPEEVGRSVPAQISPGTASMQFVPVGLAAARLVDRDVDEVGAEPQPVAEPQPIQIELRRGSTQLTVRWPSSQAQACAAWLREVAGPALK